MRIALCFSGQPRTWAKCHENWKQTFSHLGEVDCFFHFWDYNSHPAFVSHQTGLPCTETLISEDEKQAIIQTLQPKSFMFESKKETTMPARVWVEKPIGWWVRSQFYGIRKAAWLKRQYEIQNDFEYDLVFRMRSDAWFPTTMGTIDVKPNTVYTVHSNYDQTFNRYRIADTFWAADSHSYDQMSNFYRFLDIAGENNISYTNESMPPELALYPYMKSIGLMNQPLWSDVKLMRTDEHVTLMGGVQDYEKV